MQRRSDSPKCIHVTKIQWIKKREILVSVRFKSGHKDIGHSRRVRVQIFETIHTYTWFKAMLNMMQEQIVLCKQGMLC